MEHDERDQCGELQACAQNAALKPALLRRARLLLWDNKSYRVGSKAQHDRDVQVIKNTQRLRQEFDRKFKKYQNVRQALDACYRPLQGRSETTGHMWKLPKGENVIRWLQGKHPKTWDTLTCEQMVDEASREKLGAPCAKTIRRALKKMGYVAVRPGRGEMNVFDHRRYVRKKSK